MQRWNIIVTDVMMAERLMEVWSAESKTCSSVLWFEDKSFVFSILDSRSAFNKAYYWQIRWAVFWYLQWMHTGIEDLQLEPIDIIPWYMDPMSSLHCEAGWGFFTFSVAQNTDNTRQHQKSTKVLNLNNLCLLCSQSETVERRACESLEAPP